MNRYFDYTYILATLGFTVYGQIILKWRISQLGPLPVEFLDKVRFLVAALFDPAIFSGFSAAFLASLAWMAAMTKFDLSHAYPFMSINFVVVLLLSSWVLSEPMSMQKTLGVGLIVFGTVVAARG
ncbi:EamA family transporter (plasmid) [Peteryoungia desertarenae]|uniref:EamA family transporter n=1 Tax=Peteryoungia desertarenae TaxID=1813451 RepID=A0ABX6QU14_9HYPH|nr:EamA family transporter [Peteryoungia desertarenae]QLF71680.1 EamA family transporter [Peteryoungia desertarenae]